MNIKSMVPLILAAALGLAAAFVGWRIVERPIVKNVDPKGVNVVTVKDDIKPGDPLSAGDLTLTTLSTAEAPEGAFASVDELVGRVAVSAIRRGQVIYDSALASKGSGAGLAALVPQGMRAISIQVDEFNGVGNLLVPGSRVDVVATIPVEQGQGIMARTICQDLKVTAVGQQLSVSADKDKDGDSSHAAKSVTLLATPKQVQLIQLATSTGRPRLVLRSNTDDVQSILDGMTLAQLRDENARETSNVARIIGRVGQNTATPANVKATSTVRTVQIIRGTTESTVEFKEPLPSAVSQLSME